MKERAPRNTQRTLEVHNEHEKSRATVSVLVGLALLIALITNAIRRRQAEKFDRDVAEAAAEAASNARNVNFDDDDYGYRDPHLTGYSDGSHGTYGQPPMQVGGGDQQYGMSEVNQYDPYANAGVPVTIAGAAGIGTAGVNRQKSLTAPYNAFAGPGNNTNAPYASAAQGMHDLPSQASDQSLRYRQRGPSVGNQLDLLQAAGLGGAPGSVAAAAARGTPLPPGVFFHQLRPPEPRFPLLDFSIEARLTTIRSTRGFASLDGRTLAREYGTML